MGAGCGGTFTRPLIKADKVEFMATLQGLAFFPWQALKQAQNTGDLSVFDGLRCNLKVQPVDRYTCIFIEVVIGIVCKSSNKSE